MRVTGVITQGAKRIGSPEYVKSYKVAYSDDGKTWRTYKVKGTDEDIVRHFFNLRTSATSVTQHVLLLPSPPYTLLVWILRRLMRAVEASNDIRRPSS